jgi:hypothetical protein
MRLAADRDAGHPGPHPNRRCPRTGLYVLRRLILRYQIQRSDSDKPALAECCASARAGAEMDVGMYVLPVATLALAIAAPVANRPMDLDNEAKNHSAQAQHHNNIP